MVASIILNIALVILVVAYLVIKNDNLVDSQKKLSHKLRNIRDSAYKIKNFKQLYLVTREFSGILEEPKAEKNIALYNELKAYLDMRHHDILQVSKAEDINQNFTIN